MYIIKFISGIDKENLLCIVANSFHNVYGDEIGTLYMDENIRRLDVVRRQPNQTRLSYEDVSQLPFNLSFHGNTERGNLAQMTSEAMDLEFDSEDETLNFETSTSLSVPNAKKSSSSVTPR